MAIGSLGQYNGLVSWWFNVFVLVAQARHRLGRYRRSCHDLGCQRERPLRIPQHFLILLNAVAKLIRLDPKVQPVSALCSIVARTLTFCQNMQWGLYFKT